MKTILILLYYIVISTNTWAEEVTAIESPKTVSEKSLRAIILKSPKDLSKPIITNNITNDELKPITAIKYQRPNNKINNTINDGIYSGTFKIKRIELIGISQIHPRELQEYIHSLIGTTFSMEKIIKSIRKIKQYYVQKGKAEPKIQIPLHKIKDGKVYFQITEIQKPQKSLNDIIKQVASTKVKQQKTKQTNKAKTSKSNNKPNLIEISPRIFIFNLKKL